MFSVRLQLKASQPLIGVNTLPPGRTSTLGITIRPMSTSHLLQCIIFSISAVKFLLTLCQTSVTNELCNLNQIDNPNMPFFLFFLSLFFLFLFFFRYFTFQQVSDFFHQQTLPNSIDRQCNIYLIIPRFINEVAQRSLDFPSVILPVRG